MKKVKIIISALLIFAFVMAMPLLNASAEENKKTDYYKMTEISDGAYRLDIYGQIDFKILKDKRVTRVDFHDSSFESLEKLPKNRKIGSMYFHNCTIESLDGIEKYSSLSALGFKNTDVQDISKIEKLKELNCLGLSNMDVKDLSVISKLDKLSILNFTGCRFKDLSVIPDLETLVQAEFFYCNMESISGIERISTLERLYFSTVGIEDISPVAKLQNLTDLALEYTNIKDLRPIESLMNLKTLDIDNCLRIESLESLKKLNNLKTLWARNCQMALTEDVLEHLKKIGTDTDFTEADLKIKEDITDIFNSLKLDEKSDKEKVEIVIQYVVDNMKYDFDVSREWRQSGDDDDLMKYNDNALKYALQGTGCCRNYSALTNVLLTMAGVDAYEIINYEHIWNGVKLDGEFYWIDTIRIDEIDKGNLAESPDYMTQNEDFFELHKTVTLPSSYNILMNAQQNEEVTEENEKTVTENIDVGVIILLVIVAVSISGFFVLQKKK